MRRVRVFLITVALIAGTVGCSDGAGGGSYTLTIASTSGGSVTEPGEGTFTYKKGTVVNLVAEPDVGYRFVNWTANVDTIANVEASATNITMNGHRYIIANFGLEIRDWYDLDAVRDNLDGHHILVNDLDSTTAGYEELASPTANQGKGWEPIGTHVYLHSFIGFDGTFDGQGHEIHDLSIDRPDEGSFGLFGAVGDGVIQDTGAVNVTVIGQWYVGGLVGLNRGTVRNCYSTGTVSGHTFVGGLVGSNDYSGTVSNSYSTASVTGSNGIVGGLVGENKGTVSNSYSTGSVTGGRAVGGLVANYGGTLSNSHYNYDEVLINGENIITYGALFSTDFEEWLANDKFLDVSGRFSQEDGYCVIDDVDDFKELLAFGQDGSLKFRLKNDLDLAADSNFYVPYLAGEFDGNGHKISNLSFNFGFVALVGSFGYLAPSAKVTRVGVENVNITTRGSVGGLAGFSQGTVSNSYSTGNVTGEMGVGGLMGSNGGTVSNSYSSASVTGECCYVGGLVGSNGGAVSNSYSTGSVTGDYYVGGLMAVNGGTVINSYSTGSVTGNDYIGGMIGDNHIDGTVINSFWDTGTSGQATSDGGTGKTTAEMQDIATFAGAGWNIVGVSSFSQRNPVYVWNIVNGVTYPFLSWQPVS